MMGEDDADDMSEGSFNSKSVWARMSVIAAGPVFNLILAWILCSIMVGWIGYSVRYSYRMYLRDIRQRKREFRPEM